MARLEQFGHLAGTVKVAVTMSRRAQVSARCVVAPTGSTVRPTETYCRYGVGNRTRRLRDGRTQQVHKIARVADERR